MALYRMKFREARHKHGSDLCRLVMVAALAMTVGACSTPLRSSFGGSAGFGFFSSGDKTGSVASAVHSESLPVLFGESRWKPLQDALKIALSESTDGDTVSWQDDAKGGSVTVISTFANEQGAECRNLAIADHASDAGELIFNACRNASNAWIVEPTGAARTA